METNSGQIDHHRPWIRDERDAPAAMDWAQTLLNPFGTSSKLHFSRAWTFSFMGRLLLYIVPSFAAAILGVAGASPKSFNEPVNLALFTVPALLVPFAIFTIATEYTSFAAHFRRLADARRPTWLAIIVLVPMILGLLAYAAGTQGGAAQHRAMNAPPVAKEAEEKADGEAEAAKPKQQPQRRGPPGPPQSERQAAVAAGMALGVPVWALTSFGVMLWTLLYVARLPNGGRGRFRTGSDLTAEEIEAGV